MCYAAYIGVNEKQNIEEFIPNATYLFLEELTRPNEQVGVRSKFSKNNIYYVGAYEGCSCGFAVSEATLEEYIESRDSLIPKIYSIQALINLIDKLRQIEIVEFYCCWEDEWEYDIKEFKEITKKKYFS